MWDLTIWQCKFWWCPRESGGGDSNLTFVFVPSVLSLDIVFSIVLCMSSFSVIVPKDANSLIQQPHFPQYYKRLPFPVSYSMNQYLSLLHCVPSFLNLEIISLVSLEALPVVELLCLLTNPSRSPGYFTSTPIKIRYCNVFRMRFQVLLKLFSITDLLARGCYEHNIILPWCSSLLR